ncbi:MAG: creatininase family protein [Candidatus Eremiobacteraeota bacterium]|nr:creatininase family protein [Candidatus Eremiobacteraeota bacterium]MCW5866035.1 creatininase family protein [Candidatus Eremiobacteraeota bacterium]
MHWKLLTYLEIQALDRATTVPILPVGAIEAHGPHLPLCTDDIISEAMAESACRQLPEYGLRGIILPTWSFNPAGFAREHSGTLHFSAATTRAMFQDLGDNLQAQGWRTLAVANSHFDPTHLESLKQALQNLPLQIAFPDLTRGQNARRLTAEFQSGACHAGQYETSIVLARQPQLVKDHQLPQVPHSLVEAMRQGKSTFAEAGGPRAYFGTPAQASPEEGRLTVEELGRILVEAIFSTTR